MAAILGAFLFVICLAPDRTVKSERVVAKPTRAVVEEMGVVESTTPIKSRRVTPPIALAEAFGTNAKAEAQLKRFGLTLRQLHPIQVTQAE